MTVTDSPLPSLLRTVGRVRSAAYCSELQQVLGEPTDREEIRI